MSFTTRFSTPLFRKVLAAFLMLNLLFFLLPNFFPWYSAFCYQIFLGLIRALSYTPLTNSVGDLSYDIINPALITLLPVLVSSFVAYLLSDEVKLIGRKRVELDERELLIEARNGQASSILAITVVLVGLILQAISTHSMIASSVSFSSSALMSVLIVIATCLLVVPLWNDQSAHTETKHTLRLPTWFKINRNLGLVIVISTLVAACLAGYFTYKNYHTITRSRSFEPVETINMIGMIHATILIDPKASQTQVFITGPELQVSSADFLEGIDDDPYTPKELSAKQAVTIQTSIYPSLLNPSTLEVIIITPKLIVLNSYEATIQVEGNCNQKVIPNVQAFSATQKNQVTVDCVNAPSVKIFGEPEINSITITKNLGSKLIPFRFEPLIQ